MKDSEDVLQEIERSKGKYRTIIQAGIAQWVKDFQAGKIKITTVDDLRKLVEMDLDILNQDYRRSKAVLRDDTFAEQTRRGGGGRVNGRDA